MNTPSYSRDNLYSFIDYVSRKGLVKSATAANWKNAAIRLLGNLDETEESDLRSIDLESVCTRFANLEGRNMTPSSMQVYKSRLKTALSDFFAYTESPMSYKPGIAQRSGKSNKPNQIKPKTTKPQTKDLTSPEIRTQQEPHLNHSGQTKGFVFPIPLRSDLTVEIRHIPFDLSEHEAERIAMVIKALAKKDKL